MSRHCPVAIDRTFWDVLGRVYGGEGGIRTPGSLSTTPDFESGAFNRTLPPLRVQKSKGHAIPAGYQAILRLLWPGGSHMGNSYPGHSKFTGKGLAVATPAAASDLSIRPRVSSPRSHRTDRASPSASRAHPHIAPASLQSRRLRPHRHIRHQNQLCPDVPNAKESSHR